MTLTIFLVGLPAMLLCLVVQTAVTFWCVRHHVRQSAPHATSGLWRGMRPLAVAMLVMMMVGNLFQIGLWGALFMVIGEFSAAYEAVYRPAVNVTSLGYGDVVMSRPWKLLGPLEAVNGVLMLGMTAAALMAIQRYMIKSQHDSILRGAELRA